jgi:hypothetical protein
MCCLSLKQSGCRHIHTRKHQSSPTRQQWDGGRDLSQRRDRHDGACVGVTTWKARTAVNACVQLPHASRSSGATARIVRIEAMLVQCRVKGLFGQVQARHNPQGFEQESLLLSDLLTVGSHRLI